MPYTEEKDEEEEEEGVKKRVLGAYKWISCQVQRQLQLSEIHHRRRSGVQLLEREEKTETMQVWLDGPV